MLVRKFGGSSLRDAAAIENAMRIAASGSAEEPVWVVVSAMGGVTDALLHLAATAARKDAGYRQVLDAVTARHEETARLLESDAAARRIAALLEELRQVCDGIFALGEMSAKVTDRVMAFGELCSAQLAWAALERSGVAAQVVDTRDVVVTDDAFGGAKVLWEETRARVSSLSVTAPVAVFPGFVARDTAGRVTTLGRNGSDYTAALLGAAGGARCVEIWTDVSGVLTADPSVVPQARPIPAMTYEEAMELSHFGAEVIFAPTLRPLVEPGIPLVVKNTFAPDDPGTVISARPGEGTGPITGVSAISDVAFVRVEGAGMVGAVGLAGRLFTALAEAGVNVIVISQGSSEHSICFAVAQRDVARAVAAIQEAFAEEMEAKKIDAPVVEEHMSVVAVVGEKMRRKPGIAGAVFSALGQAEVNVVAIAQGSSERNITMVLAQDDVPRALSAVHSAFFA